jgi:hypothetical protein
VRQAVSSNCILDEVCAKPLQQYWLGACLKFWNGMTHSNSHLLRSIAKSDLRFARDFPQCSCWSAKIAKKLQQHGVTLQFTKTDQVLAQEAIKKWELNWLAIGREEERGDPEDKETAHKAVARHSQWFRVIALGGEARLHPYLCSGLINFEGAYPRRCQASIGLPWVESRSRALGRGQTPMRIHPISTA